jgi:hypothetical protein
VEREPNPLEPAAASVHADDYAWTVDNKEAALPENEYEVKVTLGDAQVEVRGAQEGVVEIVRALSEVLAQRTPAPAPRPGSEAQAATDEGGRARQVDARSLFKEKAPSTQSEAVAVAAFYLSELAPGEMKSGTIDQKRARDVFRQARFPLPKRIDQVLVNAQRAGYITRVKAGEYTLSPVGYNLVEHTLWPGCLTVTTLAINLSTPQQMGSGRLSER